MIIIGGVLNSNIESPSIMVYPNPVQSIAVIQLNIIKPDVYRIEIFDINGKLIKFVAADYLPADEYSYYLDDIGKLNAGMYLVRISSEKGYNVTTKLIKN
jgi:hypothetical protein